MLRTFCVCPGFSILLGSLMGACSYMFRPLDSETHTPVVDTEMLVHMADTAGKEENRSLERTPELYKLHGHNITNNDPHERDPMIHEQPDRDPTL
jgi:hypothetical protein